MRYFTVFPLKPTFVVPVLLSLLLLPYCNSLASVNYKNFNKNLLNKKLYLNPFGYSDSICRLGEWEA